MPLNSTDHLTPTGLHLVTGPLAYDAISAEMEAEAVYHAIHDGDFWAAIGRYLEPDALREDHAKLLMRAANMLHTEGIKVHPNTVMNRLTESANNGEITHEDIGQAEAWLEEIERGNMAGAEACTAGVAPQLKLRARQAIAQALAERNRQGGGAEVSDLVEALNATDRIGENHSVEFHGMDGGVWDMFDRMQQLDRLPTGNMELDDSMDQGIPRGSMLTIGGDPGDGKSILLADMCCYNLMRGLRTVYVTLEMGVPQTLLRMVANLTSETMQSVSAGGSDARCKYARLVENNLIAPFTVIYLPQGSSLDDLRVELRKVRTQDPRFADGWDVLYVDYGDCMAGKATDRNTYEEMKTVWAGLRYYASSMENWVVTASQLRDKDKRDGTVYDFADSKHKGRITDAGIIIQRDADDPGIRNIKVAKFRDGQAGQTIAGIMPDFSRGKFNTSFDDLEGTWGAQV